MQPREFFPFAKFNPILRGYILCKSSGLNKDQALQFIESLRLNNAAMLTADLESDLSALGGGDCSTAGDEATVENLSRRGHILINRSRYNEARTCLIMAISRGESTGAYREACEALGHMYEMGWGVPANLSIAKEWYRKAGLL